MEARIAAWDAILGARRLHKTSVSLPPTPKASISSLFAKEDAAAELLAALAKKSEDEAATKAAAAILSLKHQLEREREARRERYQNGRAAAAAAALPRRRIGLLKIGEAHVRTLRQLRGVAPRVVTEPRCVLPPILAHVLSPDALRVKRETYLRRLVREDTVRRLAYAPTQADTAPLAFKLSTSRQTNMSLMTFVF